MAIENPGYTKATPLEKLHPHALAEDLLAAVAGALPRLWAISDEAASAPRAGGKWSAKQILGHLIDSAANNHQRFVRLQLEESIALPGYEQDGWVSVQHYNQRSWVDLLTLWQTLNLHLAHVVLHSDAHKYGRVWHSYAGPVTLGFIIEDYTAHLRHHMKQILG
jgi:hypothetical protein